MLISLTTARLLIEVTGIEGQINKGSKKIAQVLSALQTVAKPGDRVCLAVNAYREKPVTQRDAEALLTREALEILVKLDVVAFSTADLFRLWVAARTDGSLGSRVVEGLLSVQPGVVRLP